MGNVAASGGYYIAMDSDRIFALPNTVTGSIGVFGVKLDFSGFLSQYGITREFISTGTLTASYDPTHPLTKPMKDNFTRNVDRYYDYFKSIVAEGRGLSMDRVEEIAQGKVFTGEQAKVLALVDELGGLNKAIAYAQRKYTGGDATVEVWPKPKTLYERLWSAKKVADADQDDDASLSRVLYSLLSLFQADSMQTEPVSLPSQGLLLTMDEDLALKYVLRECMGKSAPPAVVPLLPPPDFWA